MTAPTHTAHARFTLASALVRLAFRICPFSFVARFVEETVELAEEQDGFDGEPCEDCGGWTCQGHFWTQDGTQFRSYN